MDRNDLNGSVINDRKGVAPHPGAWIETICDVKCSDQRRESPPTRGRGSKLEEAFELAQAAGRPPPGGVDRNILAPAAVAALRGRPPPGGVDRNLIVA